MRREDVSALIHKTIISKLKYDGGIRRKQRGISVHLQLILFSTEPYGYNRTVVVIGQNSIIYSSGLHMLPPQTSILFGQVLTQLFNRFSDVLSLEI